MAENYLIFSDWQEPFGAEKAVQFGLYLKRHFKIKDENVYNVGDETDQYFGGMWKKSPDAKHTPNSELADTLERLHAWYAAFPQMKLCISNHGTRWMRKAAEAEIPSQMLRRYEEVIQAPKGWVWKKHWRVNAKKPFMVEHGDDWGGPMPHLNAAIHNGLSTAMGHHHSKAGIEHIKTNGMEVWGMVTGSLIDFEQYAFDYARNAKFKPKLGSGVVLDGGKMPIWVPYE